ncbi:MAG: hypothetical protein MZU84_00310 [Sphingobacterium sp.]|nr:hypothetical protein [Sphingobacterium sp.]
MLTPVANYNGTATAVNLQVNDNSGFHQILQQSQLLSIQSMILLRQVNDDITTKNEATLSHNVTINDTDVDGTINAATVDLDPATAGIQTTFTVAGQGTYTVDASGEVNDLHPGCKLQRTSHRSKLQGQ